MKISWIDATTRVQPWTEERLTGMVTLPTACFSGHARGHAEMAEWADETAGVVPRPGVLDRGVTARGQMSHPVVLRAADVRAGGGIVRGLESVACREWERVRSLMGTPTLYV